MAYLVEDLRFFEEVIFSSFGELFQVAMKPLLLICSPRTICVNLWIENCSTGTVSVSGTNFSRH